MTLYVQHGYGKGDKISRLLDASLASGVILSPADEREDKLLETARAASDRGAVVLLDPQLYVATIPNGVARCHEDNSLNYAGVRWSADTDLIDQHVEQVVALNRRVGTNAVVSPAPLQTAFLDTWASVALQYARATVRVSTAPTYVSITIDEAALADWNAISHWLNEVTTLDCEGFYIIVARRDRPYPQLWDPALLMNLLRLVYRLGVLNRYSVVLGYTDVAGLLALAAGATAFGTGWFYSLRNFTTGKWVPKGGGAPPSPRLLSRGLLSPLEGLAEASPIARSSLGDFAFPDDDLRRRLAADEQIPVGEARLQHLEEMGRLVSELHNDAGPPASGRDVLGRTNDLFARLDEGLGALNEAERLGLPLGTGYRAALSNLQTALGGFLDAEALG